MSNRKNLTHEGLEIYLLNLLLANRPLLFVCGIFLLFYTIVMVVTTPWAGLLALLSGSYLLLLSFSYNTSFQVAKIGAQIASF